jgi:hypothetical protein
VSSVWGMFLFLGDYLFIINSNEGEHFVDSSKNTKVLYMMYRKSCSFTLIMSYEL